MNDKSPIDLSRQSKLRQAIEKLPEAAEPTRDLWPEIESQLQAKQPAKANRSWFAWSIAATLLLSFGSLLISWEHWQNTQRLIAEQQSQSQLFTTDDIQLQIKSMEQAYGLAKSALLAQIGMKSNQAGSDLLIDVQANLEIIEQATIELKSAIVKQPDNPSLPRLLKATYQQELAVLRQLAQLDFGV